MIAIAALFFMLAILPPRAFAQCEPNGALLAAQDGIAAQYQNGVAAMMYNVHLGWATALDILRSQIGVEGRDRIISKLNEFWGGGIGTAWESWGGSWKGMARELSSGTIYQTREQGRIADTANVIKAATEMQKQKLKSKIANQPTEATCRFDTMASSLTAGREMGRALENTYEWDVMKNGNNQVGSAGETGPANMQTYRWRMYKKYFCDYRAEGGHGNSGCGGSDDEFREEYKNRDVLPGRMLFAKDTIDLADAVQRKAVLAMVYNISDYKVSSPVLKGAFDSKGVELILARRSYLAQMNAVNGLIYSVVSSRAPGPANPDIQALRQHEGIPEEKTSPNPSSHETRKAIVEQLWDPNYYKSLYDSPSTIGQKEVYLRAYNLMMLNDLISRQERISNVYAIETANLLSETDGGRGSVSSTQPLRTERGP